MKPIVSVIILGAGTGSRFGGDKMTFSLCGKAVIERSTEVFQKSDRFSEIIITASEENREIIEKLTSGYSKVKAVIQGGDSRTESTGKALSLVREDADFIAIHDGARPLLSVKTAEETLDAAMISGGAIPVMPIKDTLKVCCENTVIDTADRSRLFSAATPQIFDFPKYKKLFGEVSRQGISYTDDSRIFEAAGFRVACVESNRENIKITYPEDRIIAECLLREMRSGK